MNQWIDEPMAYRAYEAWTNGREPSSARTMPEKIECTKQATEPGFESQFVFCRDDSKFWPKPDLDPATIDFEKLTLSSVATWLTGGSQLHLLEVNLSARLTPLVVSDLRQDHKRRRGPVVGSAFLTPRLSCKTGQMLKSRICWRVEVADFHQFGSCYDNLSGMETVDLDGCTGWLLKDSLDDPDDLNLPATRAEAKLLAIRELGRRAGLRAEKAIQLAELLKAQERVMADLLDQVRNP